MFICCTTVLHRLSPIGFPFTFGRHSEDVIPDALSDAVTGPWALAVMALLVLGDAFLVVVPGEIAVTALGALSTSTGTPPLWAVILCAAAAAACGDLLCYGIGRWVGLDRWRWMRTERLRRAQRWARGRLEAGTAVVLFTARFIPFARLSINLVAGATGIPFARYLGLVVLAASGWATYQAAIGALLAVSLPGAPIASVLLSVVFAIGLGGLIDLVIRRRARRRNAVAAEVPSD
jgi:membrane protein DedA with SNARE-associated domain